MSYKKIKINKMKKIRLYFKEKKDYITYVSTLDYCIADILENFKTNIDYYYKSILEEVEQKKIVF